MASFSSTRRRPLSPSGRPLRAATHTATHGADHTATHAAEHTPAGPWQQLRPWVLIGWLGLLGGQAPVWADDPAPPMHLRIDATDLQHRVIQVEQTLAVQPGPLRLLALRWVPGSHSPVVDVGRLAGLQIEAAGQPLAWQRDALDTHAFVLTVPTGVQQLQLRFQQITPLSPAGGRVVMTPDMLNLQWYGLLLYPAGRPAAEIPVQATVRLPAGWQAGTALRPQGDRPSDAQITRYATVPLTTLVDSPIFAGRHVRRIALDAADAASAAAATRPVNLHVMADTAEALAASDAQLDAHRRLVQQADRLFGSRPFDHYDFLLALSDQVGGIGLEHHQSSENALPLKYFEAWDKGINGRELLPHEYAHAWNGKLRRPAGLATPDFNTPMQGGLLWVYEGQTEFWGWVLAARSGLVSPELSRQGLALLAADMGQRPGRQWRSLQDTTLDPIMAQGRGARDWPDLQRTRGDYYWEGLLVWLDADMLIREASHGQRSLDDFARAFFGGIDGLRAPLTYEFDDVVAALNHVWPHDWAAFLRQRLDARTPAAPLDGLVRAGWALSWADTPSDELKAREQRRKFTDFRYSLGLTLAADGKLGTVEWDGPAFRAGLAPGMQLVAVSTAAAPLQKLTPERLKQAIQANRQGEAPIELLVLDGESYRNVRIDWRGGLRYPVLKALPGQSDRLSALLAPR